MNTLKTATSLLLGVLSASPVLAVGTGSQTLGVGDPADATNTDVWQLVCPGGTSKAQAYVSDTNTINNAAALVSVILVEIAPGAVGTFQIDPNEGGARSNWAVAATGPGTYQVAISKSASGDESYSGKARCVSNTGATVRQTSFNKTKDQ